ncbi:amino acid transporter [Sphingomonas oleivorans]|uniref:Amino acid transporter n=2 Tax=Sphingomonas oleivorans TaxID=1735121 RepID=A0A2T5G0E0_9SPHN|nr:amino acid transporter [Sphingomonas oleivorans]
MLPATPQPLPRCLGFFGILFLTLSVATPASSLFVIVPGMLQVAGTGALWALLLAGIVCVATAFIYAELSSAWPVAGGEYVMVAQTLGPLAGFVMLGINVFNNLLFPPVAALGVSAILATVLPGLPQVPVAVAVMLLSTVIGLLNIRINALITGIFLGLEVLALAIVALLGLADAARPLPELLLHPMMPVEAALAPASAASIGLATTIAIFALNGYGAAVYFGEEMHEAPRLIARAILAALGLTLLFEGLPILAGLIGAPDLQGFLTADDPFGLLVRDRGGGALAGWVSIGVAVAIVNAIIACILACARFFYGTARDCAWGRPLDAWLVAVHPRFGSPWIGTLLIGAVGTVACFLPPQFLLVLSGAGLVAIYAGICLAVMVGRRTGATAHAHYHMPLYPLAPLVTLAALGYVVWTSWLDPEEGRPGLIVTAAQIALSALYYALVLRRRGLWQVHIPAPASAL